MPTLDQILSDPGYQALKPEERTGIRRSFYQQTAKDPGFRSLSQEERQSIFREILFPASEYPETERAARPKPTIGEAFSGGIKALTASPKNILEAVTDPLSLTPSARQRNLERIGGALEMAGSPLQPAANLVSGAGERVSDYLSGKGYGRTADVAAGLTTAVGDYATGLGLAKGAGMLKAPLARALPTIKERVAPLQAQKELLPTTTEQRLADLDKLATEAQATTSAAQAGRMQQIPATRQAIQDRAGQEIGAVERQLTEHQRAVGLEAAQAGAPVGPKRMNFEKRYTDLERAADSIPIQPVNLNSRAYGLTREPGIRGTPTLPAERSAAVITRTLTEADPEEIGHQVQRMLTSGAEAKAPDYKAITKVVLGPATADDVTAGELLRARKRLREAERVAYRADHKNLARQWSELEDGITEDLKAAAKTDKRAATVYRTSRNLDKDYFKKKSLDWYKEGVDQAFDPATGAWDRKRFTKWWEKHADSTNNDKDLRRLLGDRYEGTKGLIEDMQKATELNIEQAAKESIRNIKRRMGQEIREVGGREKQIGELSKQTGKQIQTARTEGGKAIKREAELTATDIEGQIEKITGKPYMGQFSKAFGGLQFLGGIGGIVYGTVTANPTLIGGGAAAAASGAWTVMSHDAFIKLINAPRGLSIARRLVRAAPGTGEAIAASSAATRILRDLESQENEPAQERPGLNLIEPSGPGTKESVMRKYGIQ